MHFKGYFNVLNAFKTLLGIILVLLPSFQTLFKSFLQNPGAGRVGNEVNCRYTWAAETPQKAAESRRWKKKKNFEFFESFRGFSRTLKEFEGF